MTTFTVDHRLLTALQKEFDFSEKQAEGIIATIEQLDIEHLATKQDIADMRHDIQHLETVFDKKNSDMEVRVLRWMIPLILGQTAVFAFIVKWVVG